MLHTLNEVSLPFAAPQVVNSEHMIIETVSWI
jgi:hypothetical protein